MSEFRKNIILDPNTRIWFDYKLKIGKSYFTIITHNNRIRMYWEENSDSYMTILLEPQTSKNLELSDEIERLAHMCYNTEYNETKEEVDLDLNQ